MRFFVRRLPSRCLILIASLSLILQAGCRDDKTAMPPRSIERQPPPGVALLPAGVPPAVAADPSQSPAPIDEDELPPQPAAPADVVEPPVASPRPLVAIIIDDMGYNRELGRQLLQLEPRLSFSFLPSAPFTQELAALAFETGHDILVHLPMEPKENRWRLEPETLLATDSPDQIRKKIEGMLATMPHATGASNHMGSRFSEVAPGMRVVIETLQARSLFFVDSFTSPNSQGLATARRLHLPSARRHLFLDNDQHTGAICRQLALLATLANRQGQAIGIGHPHQTMLTALSQCGPEALQSVDMVGVHRLVQ